MRLIPGLVSSQEAPNPLDPFTLQDAWTSLPANWSESGASSPTYNSDGAFPSDPVLGSQWTYTDTLPASEIISVSMMIAFNVFDWNGADVLATIHGTTDVKLGTKYFPGTAFDQHRADAGADFLDTDTTPNDTGAIHVIAMTVHQDGTFKLFKFTPLVPTPEITTDTITPLLFTASGITVDFNQFDAGDAVTGFSGDFEIIGTRFGINEQAGSGELSEADVIELAGSLGWVGSTFDPAAFIASAVVDQDWTGLGGTPAGWTVDTGTPIYDSTGLQNNGSNLKLTLDMSAGSDVQVPGWLLNVYEYTDVTTHGFESWVADATEDTKFSGKTEYGGSANNLLIEAHRIEVGAGVSAAVTVNVPQTLNPTANKIYSGPLANFEVGFDTYLNLDNYYDSDPDFNGGQFIDGPFTPPGTAGFDPSDAHHLSVRLFDSVSGGTTLIRTLFWPTVPDGNNFDSHEAVLVALGYLGPT